MSTDYVGDFYAWSMEQAGLLRSGRYSLLDIQHLAEEIEALGKRERRALKNAPGSVDQVLGDHWPESRSPGPMALH